MSAPAMSRLDRFVAGTADVLLRTLTGDAS